MLETLKIRNIAIIDSAEIPFKPGLNILSGETGAGKSIVIESISVLLGSRVSADLIRTGSDEAVVEGLFDIKDIPWAKTRLEKLGFDASSDELLIKRTIHRTGKHRISINGELATLSSLQELCEGLVDLCSQHEHQSLIKTQTQLELLDRYGNLGAQTRAFGERFARAQTLFEERDELQAAEADRSKREDFLRFQIDELSAAAFEPGEDLRLQTEKQLLTSAETRVQTAEAARQALESSESGDSSSSPGAVECLRLCLQKLRSLSQLDEQAIALEQGVERALVEAEEASLALHRYLGSVDLNPERLEEVQSRLSLLVDLKRKYGASIEAIVETLARLQDEYSRLGEAAARLQSIAPEIEAARAELAQLARKLGAARRKTADLLSASVTAELKDLNMSGAEFRVELTALEEWNAHGSDLVQFLVRANRGESEKTLGKTASGGELSRLMLAIRRVISNRGGIGVYLFDEIDAGIGGQTAFQVGKKLKSVAAYNQVICITHLPQVASFADHHLSVRKGASGKRTVTEVASLSAKERKEELARMLGGPELTRKSLENAAELIELARG